MYGHPFLPPAGARQPVTTGRALLLKVMTAAAVLVAAVALFLAFPFYAHAAELPGLDDAGIVAVASKLTSDYEDAGR